MNLDVQVETVRYEGNGSIFTGRVLDGRGIQTGAEILVRCSGSVLHPRQAVFKGETWSVSGFEESYKGCPQLKAARMHLMRPAGANIIAAIAFNRKFERIGEKRARDLWAAFGEDLYKILDAGDTYALTQIITPEAAGRLASAWQEEYSGDLYQWMDQCQMSPALGRKLHEYYGKDARAAVEADPYRLLSFGPPWGTVDGLARRLGVAEDDPRRQHAAVAAVLYGHFAKGHTAVATEPLVEAVARLLCSNEGDGGTAPAGAALKHSYKDGAFVRTGDVWQATGIFLIEAFVAERIRELLSAEECGPPETTIREVIEQYRAAEHPLGEEQEEAILLALRNKCCVITGGAGVGKTSVLRCLCDIIKAGGGHVMLMALSGRAAKRMEEASGHPARTIAGFLHNVKQEELDRLTHVVIDEASMLDVVSAFRILRRLPERVCMIFVGDPYQLPPIGAGLTFHVLAETGEVPVGRLTKVYRQSGQSGIPAISNAIRSGEWPIIPEYCGKGSGVFSLPASPDEITTRLLEIYEELGGTNESEDVQILSAIKADNPYGVVGINKVFHARYTEGEEIVLVRSPEGDLRDSGFRRGDEILVTKNQWARGLFNGSLGRVNEALKVPTLTEDGRLAVARAVIDGKDVCLAQDDLSWIVYGYSISVHKAQGSQFRRVIVPLSKSRLLDRTLIYTAVTRGVEQVLLLGDLAAARAAVKAPPHAWLRRIGFDTLLRRRLDR